MYVDKHQRNWDVLVPYVLFAYRTLYNPTVKNVPFYLLFGYEPILPHEFPLLPPHVNQSQADRHWNTLAHRLNVARKLAREAVARVQAATKNQVDANRRDPPQYKPGDLVMALQPYVAPGGTMKLASDLYQGPYRVERYMPGFRTVKLTRVSNGKPRLVHIDNLKPVSESPLRPSLPDIPDPQPTEEQQRRAIDMLERACLVAKHVVGQGRARAAISSILGPTGLPPLSPEIQSFLDKQSPAARTTIVQSSADASVELTSGTEPAIPFAAVVNPPRPPTPPRVHQNVNANWKPAASIPSTPWFQVSSGDAPADVTRSGRRIRK